ncbi:hypothetical protein HY949_05240 [Candidatus Gottesmanbacteria bacterium]|nr:hypothetical protein [Candidatus Gottesmanbacteria bacterium]
MSINKETSVESDVRLARAFADKEILTARLDPNGEEAGFHRFRTMAFGTMGVQPPKTVQDINTEVLPWIDPSSGERREMIKHLHGGKR